MPSDEEGSEDLQGSGKVSKQTKTPSYVFLSIGLNILILLMMIPFWNAILMLRDPLFQHFLGNQVPAQIVSMCAIILVAYIVTIPVFFHRSHAETQTEQTMLTIGKMFITLLGGLSLVIAYPIPYTATAIHTELATNSKFGPGAYEIFNAYLSAQALRNSTGCRELNSVELCAGFHHTPSTELLKYMERNLRCSGWGAAADPSYDYPLEPRPIDVRNSAREAWPSGALGASSLDHRRHTSGPHSTPLPLFSKTNTTASCDGMAGRHLKYFLEDVASELYYEGFYLLFIASIVGFLSLLGTCTGSSPRLKRIEYGSIEEARAYRGDPEEVRRVVQNLLQR